MTGNAEWLEGRVQHMREACRNIRADVGQATKEQFLADGKTQRAVIESIMVIGEAASRVMRLDPSMEQTHAELWQQFRDASEMRNLLTHEYFRVDPSVVWTTVNNDLPELERPLIGFTAG